VSDDRTTTGGSHDEEKSPKDRLLDLFVFGPAGLALTAAEEFPKLVDKGRHRVEGQVRTARLVGQFAVQMGRQQIESGLGNLLRRPDAGERPPVVVEGPEPVVSPHPPAPSAAAASPAPVAAAAAVEPASVPGAAPSSNGTMASDALAIPGYDSLSASQVVQRLGGLSAPELTAVREHELAHRHRRTILSRVDQLLSGAEPES